MTEQLAFLTGYRYTWPDRHGHDMLAVGFASTHTILPSSLPMYRPVTAHEMLAP